MLVHIYGSRLIYKYAGLTQTQCNSVAHNVSRLFLTGVTQVCQVAHTLLFISYGK